MSIADDEEMEKRVRRCADRINFFLKTREVEEAEKDKIKEVLRTHQEVNDACLAFLCHQNEMMRRELEAAREKIVRLPDHGHDCKVS